MARATDDIISQKLFLKQLKTVEFHLQCLEDTREAAHQEALEQYCDVGRLDDKIEAYRKLGSLDDIMDKTDLALEESKMLDLSSQYVSRLQIEALRLSMMSKRLHDENDWLTKENKVLSSRIQQLQGKIRRADADMQQHLLMCQIRQTDSFKVESKLSGTSIERNLQPNKHIMLNLSSQFKALYSLVLQYINSGRFDVAVSLCNQSRSGRKLASADDALITYIQGLAALRQRNSEEAVKLLESACELMSSSKGKNNICLVPFLVGYGKALRLAKKYNDSLSQLQTALAIKQSAKESVDEEVWSIKVDMASDMIKMDQSKEASQLLVDTLSQATKSLSQTDNVVVLIKNYLARCYINIGQINEALGMITAIIQEVFQHDEAPSIPSILKTPAESQVTNGGDLVRVCQHTNSMLELFTLQSLIMIYLDTKNEKSADILNEYIRIHSIDYEIE